ncbi:hypothetical protein-signal peptide prediction [Algibacter lectus]|uniref:Uncharacterized protein n=1 Tax=Algibacter lectus TaxID=221126 RepID=A0A090X0I6_9FLAO|nr:hypothetical protein [Algibacter lectus]GAL82038.1 hypothetical protein-signal peptide prediction [Algibacter lectus]
MKKHILLLGLFSCMLSNAVIDIPSENVLSSCTSTLKKLQSLNPIPTANKELWSHINNNNELINEGVTTTFSHANGETILSLKQTQVITYASTSILAPNNGWELENNQYITAVITNTSAIPLEVTLWVVPDHGWDAVADRQTIDAGCSLQFQCNIRATYKDGTPKLNPKRIKKIQIMLSKASKGATLKVKKLTTSGTADNWIKPVDRMEVPNMEYLPFAAGKRVRYQLPIHKDTDIYSALYLPKTWTPNGKFPVIIEFPGNIYYTNSVYSTGRPEQCAIGYGMSKNEEAIWVSVPFVDYSLGTNIKNGFGNADHTVDYTVKMVNEILTNFGGDPDNVVLTGFSRGAIACGYIGLRNDTIASLWKGFHACQHYDGDGWNGADLSSAKVRAKRIGTRALFHTDNEHNQDLKTMLTDVNANVTYANSGLGAHATAMFLDDRPSTLKFRAWYHNLINNILVTDK